jgi:iron complex outermembrane recepter protein
MKTTALFGSLALLAIWFEIALAADLVERPRIAPTDGETAREVITRESLADARSQGQTGPSIGAAAESRPASATADTKKTVHILKPPKASEAASASQSVKSRVVDRQSFAQQLEASEQAGNDSVAPRIVSRRSFDRGSGTGDDAPYVYPPDGLFRLASMLAPVTQPPPTPPTPGSPSPEPQPPAANARINLDNLPGLDKLVVQPVAQNTASPDLGGVLARAEDVKTVTVQHRSPVSQDPNIRGYKGGQIYTQADGVYWTPARRDLDTMLSKIDPDMMQDVVVVPGPYGLRYGPGFSFIDVLRAPTPRSTTGCYESHFDTIGNVRSNGGQLYGRETATGAGEDWGFRMSYGDRAGSDYRSGDNTLIPSSYHNRDAWGELSFDLNPNRRLDFAYQRLDQTDTEYPCEMFDIDSLSTYGFQTRMVDTDPTSPWSKLTMEGWYNRTIFRGSTPQPNDAFPVINRVNWALNDFYLSPQGVYSLAGTTLGGLSSSGARLAATFGDPDDMHVNCGVDFRYVEQVIGETFQQYRFGTPFDPAIQTNMPHSCMKNPGAFAEWSTPVTDKLTTSVGARADLVDTSARASDLRSNSNFFADDLNESDILYSFYFTNTYKLSEHQTVSAGFGYAQRPPTLIERYADGLFISSLQSGFTRVIGDPHLKPERDWQVDLGYKVDKERWRGNARCYYAWVVDYVTFFDDAVVNFSDARLLRYMNTPLGTLAGFELYGEYDLSARISPFAGMSYTEGRDQTLDAPLPAISPLESTVGFRYHDAEKGRRWSIDTGARMVATQNQLGTLRLLGGTTVVEERTPGFTTVYIRGYWNCNKNLRLIAGIDNVFNRNYQEHLDLRLSGPNTFPLPETRALRTGISPFFGLNWAF